MNNSELKQQLEKLVGAENVCDEMAERICYSRDCGPDKAGIPDIVVKPGSTEEVAEVVKLANKIKKAVYTWGRATTFLGSGVPQGCILLSTTRLNKILKIDPDTISVTVQAGVIWHSIDAELNKDGWELFIPGGGGLFSGTVGGSVAVNVIPHAITEYGMTGDHILGLEVVLPDGTIMRTGASANPACQPVERYANGPDVTGLFLGAYGTLGIITEITYRIRKIPEVEQFAFYAFDDYKKAAEAVNEIQKEGAATFVIGLFAGPKPKDVEGEAFIHIIVRDSKREASYRLDQAKRCCEAFNGTAHDAFGTKKYWEDHMYSWLRNVAPGPYYAGAPYMCPEVAGFMPTLQLKDSLALLYKYIEDHKAEFEKHDILIKGFDAYFTRNGVYLWIDTLYNEMKEDSWEYGLKLRGKLCDLMYGEGKMAAGGLGAGVAPHAMPKLGSYFTFLKQLKKTMDPNNVLNPGVLFLS
jgi:FAD/FMN-containing dehydrogenase